MVLGIDLKPQLTQTLSKYNTEICSEYTKLVANTCDYGNKKGAEKEKRAVTKTNHLYNRIITKMIH